MPAATLAEIADLIRDHPGTFRDATHGRFYVDHLEARSVFPLKMSKSHLDLATSVAWVLEHSTPTALSPKALLRVQQIGLDHRRHGFPAIAYASFAQALKFGLREVLRVSNEQYTVAAQQAEHLLEGLCVEMAAAAMEADERGVPPAYSGEVIDVQRMSRRISVVTLDTGLSIPFSPGQHVLTSSTMLPGMWLPMSPATPPSEFGQVEFHILGEDDAPAQRLAKSKVGDHWTFGQPSGSLSISGERDVLLLAHSTGWAPLRSLLFDLLTWEDRPRVTLFLSADYPGELYELPRLWALAQASSWLTVIPCATTHEDAWWVNSKVTLPDLYIAVADSPGSLAASRGNWNNHDILIAGPEANAQHSAAALQGAGAQHIQIEAWPQAAA
ncbi:hypothetical protein H7347_04210 [Corynebacterium sp. zg-331]|uniref:hypothetical protein n=1 Tax=unclassified Corynebacterium TaxID=2624378 RepID=UPI00128D08F3|nr:MULTISPECIES: hypothetical protein [unclassified Corynebacterium]MBC3185783.1 hypothetical protein [Corynebacterium sp. zg-331]MPV52276.1 hypothetical protein [Corynebacterium sp. zg331]